MKNCHLILFGIVTVALGQAIPARAEEVILDFEPSPQSQATDVAPIIDSEAIAEEGHDSSGLSKVKPLSIPSAAASAPVQDFPKLAKELPPPPPQLSNAASPFPELSQTTPDYNSTVNSDSPTDESLEFAHLSPALSFDLQPTHATFIATSVPTASNPASTQEEPKYDGYTLEDLIDQGTNSLVAIAIGSAEGTRTPEGDRTPSYYGHIDPGNGVWNLGSFSYQHGASSPSAADEKQLQRLHQQALRLQHQAQMMGMTLTLEEKLNALDLANQAPTAALERGGYLDRLQQAHRMGLQGEEAIAWARVRSFLDPDTRQWNAPGLGNTVESISHDQERRMDEIARAIAIYRQRHPIAQVSLSLDRTTQPSTVDEEVAIARLFNQAVPKEEEAIAPPESNASAPEPSLLDRIFNLDDF
jgi:hypothetical protein